MKPRSQAFEVLRLSKMDIFVKVIFFVKPNLYIQIIYFFRRVRYDNKIFLYIFFVIDKLIYSVL